MQKKNSKIFPFQIIENTSWRDKWGNYGIFNNKAFYMNLVLYPYLDIFALREGLIKKPDWKGHEFAVVLTHDVDFLKRADPLYNLRKIKLAFCKKLNLREIFINLFELVSSLKKMTVDEINKIRVIENKEEVKSTFFFFSLIGKICEYHYYDCFYKFSDKTPSGISGYALMHLLSSEGFEIGLHSSILSDRIEILDAQKQAIENVIKKKIVSVRKHYLAFDVKRTPKIEKKVGFKFDSSYGFNRFIGFRAGTAYPFSIGGIVEIPLIIQDSALFNKDIGLGVDYTFAWELITKIMYRVKKVGGILTLLWHPYGLPHDEGFFEFYDRFIRQAKQEGAWIATLQEVGSYWQEQGWNSVFDVLTPDTIKDLKKFVKYMEL